MVKLVMSELPEARSTPPGSRFTTPDGRVFKSAVAALRYCVRKGLKGKVRHG